uniref:Uncharacterized protein n=1 Tax=Coccolithus braarudii TaxID=221442 RepID=A0A7S0L456_9EUKA|mmetsp:Transcript_16739/g.36254  ORF Transcript_16739/g.36254 Transcript_16739/m.36254 type:complete len:103 (+) Transcript_16739:127-435(+)
MLTHHRDNLDHRFPKKRKSLTAHPGAPSASWRILAKPGASSHLMAHLNTLRHVLTYLSASKRISHTTAHLVKERDTWWQESEAERESLGPRQRGGEGARAEG